MYTLFDSFFSPTRVVVVSEERLQQAERELKENQVKVIDNRIEELTAYRNNLQKQLEPAEKSGKDLDAMDGTCDV
jgi:flagellar biosynthesis chaperone FliJ